MCSKKRVRSRRQFACCTWTENLGTVVFDRSAANVLDAGLRTTSCNNSAKLPNAARREISQEFLHLIHGRTLSKLVACKCAWHDPSGRFSPRRLDGGPNVGLLSTSPSERHRTKHWDGSSKEKACKSPKIVVDSPSGSPTVPTVISHMRRVPLKTTTAQRGVDVRRQIRTHGEIVRMYVYIGGPPISA